MLFLYWGKGSLSDIVNKIWSITLDGLRKKILDASSYHQYHFVFQFQLQFLSAVCILLIFPIFLFSSSIPNIGSSKLLFSHSCIDILVHAAYFNWFSGKVCSTILNCIIILKILVPYITSVSCISTLKYYTFWLSSYHVSVIPDVLSFGDSLFPF